MQKGWYYALNLGAFEGFYYIREGEAVPLECYNHGPFKTFTEAKKDALELFKIEIEVAEHQIEKIKNTRVRS